jgi:hypothetical protein
MPANESTLSINSKVSRLRASGYILVLDEFFLSPLVFEHVTTINIYYSVGFIQSDVFKSFEHLKSLSLCLSSPGSFSTKSASSGPGT